jgi:hypothetical protein
MTDTVKPRGPREKTPADATAFEREQLRFFLSGSDLAATLSEVNPSLAWLPVLSEMKLIQSETQLIAWIERNFADTNAVRDVVANIHFFGPNTADLLEYRLNAQAATLPPLLAKSWALIIRHMRAARRGLVDNEWFEIAPQLKRREHSAALVQRLADALCPKLKVGKRLSWRDSEEKTPERPSDLMSIDYEVQDGVSSEDVLAAWPSDADAETDESLLLQLTIALSAALADATDVGVESNEGYSISDLDVPSVARHHQNEYRSGFQLVVRVTAEIWTRVAIKSPRIAIAMAERWRESPFRLMRRLALFSLADPTVPAKLGADMLIRLPSGELFLTNSSVEVCRLIRARWKDFPAQNRNKIILRLLEGPPRAWFREGADIDQWVDGSRFDILSDMTRAGFDIGPKAKKVLEDIRGRWPQWQPKSSENTGFHIWDESGKRGLGGDIDKLEGVADNELVAEARKIAATAAFMEGASWPGLCLSDPDRALRGLDAVALNGDWPPEYWEPLLRSHTTYADAGTELRIAQLLLQWPQDSFDRIAVAVSWWLGGHAKRLPDALLWPMWDRIAGATLIGSTQADDGDALRCTFSPPGQLAEVLISKITKGDGGELPDDKSARLDRLFDAPGRPGLLARVRLAADVPYLFECAPNWTKSRLIPRFDWSSPDAADVWSVRKYSKSIGSPELFGLLKQPFVQMFGRSDTPAEDLRLFVQWLTAILIANQAHDVGYPLLPTEARSALRRAGVRALPSVGHHLAVEMERATEEQKLAHWRKVVGPVFQAIWPLDVELQTSATTFKLVQILLATGEAFPEACDIIIPFIRPDDRHEQTTVFSIAQTPDVLYEAAPSKMLDMIYAVIGEALAGSVYALGKALSRLQTINPKLANTRKFQKLLTSASPHG